MQLSIKQSILHEQIIIWTVYDESVCLIHVHANRNHYFVMSTHSTHSTTCIHVTCMYEYHFNLLLFIANTVVFSIIPLSSVMIN